MPKFRVESDEDRCFTLLMELIIFQKEMTLKLSNDGGKSIMNNSTTRNEKKNRTETGFLMVNQIKYSNFRGGGGKNQQLEGYYDVGLLASVSVLD